MSAPCDRTLDFLASFEKLPPALCFFAAPSNFLPWAALHKQAATVTSFGDLLLCRRGLHRWRSDRNPFPSVKNLGLAISTERLTLDADWAAEEIADTIFSVFPRLELVALNLEISFEATGAFTDQIWTLLEILARKKIRIYSFEVYLILARG